MRGLSAALVTIGAILLGVGAGAVDASAQPTRQQRQLQRSLSHDMAQVGGASGAYVVDLHTGQALFASRAGTNRLPASVEKLFTTSTALLRYGPTATLGTSVLGSGQLDSRGVWHGALYLRGGGDPTFGSASFDQYAYGTGATIQALASGLRSAGVQALRGRVIGDASFFDSLSGTPATGYQFSSYVEGSLSALAFNRGLTNGGSGYVTDPGKYAAQQLVAALRADGVRVPGGTPARDGTTPSGATPLATVPSPPITTLIRLTNTPSDNFFAEMLLKGVGARFGGAGTTAAGAAVVRSEVASVFHIHPHLNDGSGLSRDDRTSPRQVVTLLRALAHDHAFTHSLAIAGKTGTLQSEMQGTVAQGRCRGKTGTLHDVANLVGYCRARDRHLLAFAFLMNGLGDPAYAHGVEDKMGVAVANYDG